MLKRHTLHLILAAVVVSAVVVTVVLFGVTFLVQARTLSASADSFLCAPTAVATFTNRVHVRCSTGAAPGNAIFYFAYCSANNSAQASRFLSTFTTAKVTAKNLVIYYTASDLSGVNCGCSTADCRVLTGAEVQQ